MPAFLAGCWEQRQGDRWTEECWTAPRGGLMIGSGRNGTGERIDHWEYMRIERGADGVRPSTAPLRVRPPSPSRRPTSSARHITFANPATIIPQRVRYVATADGIDAEVSLADGTKPQRWRYRRPGSPPK